MQRPARRQQARLQAVKPGSGHAPTAQHIGQRHLVKQPGGGQAHQHLVGLAKRQVALTQQALVAGEIAQRHAHAVAVLHQLSQTHRLNLPAREQGIVGMQGRVVTDHPGAKRAEQLRQRLRRRHHAQQAHGGAAQLTPDEQALGIDHRHAAQHLQQRADHELGLGLGRGVSGPHHLNPGTGARLEVDVL